MCADGRDNRPVADRHGRGRGLVEPGGGPQQCRGGEIAFRHAPELDDVAKAIKHAGGKALAQTADIADERQVQELVLAAERWVGPATILVNNAGMVDPIVPLARSNAALWLRSVAINVGGTYLATVRYFRDADAGRAIVTISSGAQNASAGGRYTPARPLSFDDAASRSARRTGVTANAFNPGYIDTEMQERIRRTSAADFPRGDEYRAAQREGKLKHPKEPARAVAYLVLPTTQRNGETLEYTDETFRREAEAKVPA